MCVKIMDLQIFQRTDREFKELICFVEEYSWLDYGLYSQRSRHM